MKQLWSRRGVLAAFGASAFIRPATADQGLLAKLRQQGSMKIGIANNMPWSTLNPDGTLSGLAPAIITAVTPRMGIPKVEGIVATYGELVPGLLAGRWDMIGASLNIAPERCKQVAFSDPFYRRDETQWIGYIPADLPTPPKSEKEIAERFETIGLTTGTWTLPTWQAALAAGKKGTIVQFGDTPLLLEGLLTKRVPIIAADAKTMHTLREQRSGFEIASIESAAVNRGSGGAFRLADTDLRDAFVTEFRALKKSGEAAKILKAHGFEYDPEYMEISGDAACAL